jgi:hypothetical protein
VADISAITARYEALRTVLDERSRRLLAAAESQTAGKGGISIVAKAIGISRPVIRRGIAELKDPTMLGPGRIRREGGGRKRASDKDSSLKADLESLLESTTRGDPEAALPLDLQERASVNRGIEAHEAPGQPSGGGRSVA